VGLFKKIFDDILGFDPPKAPPPPVIKQKTVVQVVGPTVEQTVAVGPSADAESIQVLADALVASEALRSEGQAQLINQLFSASLAARPPPLAAQSFNGRQATKVSQPAVNQIAGESSTTGTATMLGFVIVLAALTLSKRRGR